MTASVVKVGVLGALATATIAVPVASATAGPQAVGTALPAPVAESAAPAAPVEAAAVVLPVAQAAVPADAASAAEMSVAAAPTEEKASATEVAASGTGYMAPVNASITSGYGYRTHPTLGYSKMHNGIDYGAACGTPARAAQSGTVTSVTSDAAGGNMVMVQHADGNVTGYFHLSAFKVSVGQSVEKGQTVGLVGSTGRSTGCHLHFAKMDSAGNYSDPLSLFR